MARGRLHAVERTMASLWRGHGVVSRASGDASGDSSGSEGSGAGSDKRCDGAEGGGGCSGRGGVGAWWRWWRWRGGSSGRIRPKRVLAAQWQREGMSGGRQVVRETGW